MLDLFRRLEKDPDRYRGKQTQKNVAIDSLLTFYFLSLLKADQHTEEEDEEEEYEEESGEEEDSANEQQDSGEENESVGLTPQQEELLQIVSVII